MKVLLTGATGFTGSHVLQSLLEKTHSVRCLVRSSDKATPLVQKGVEVVIGDLANCDAVTAALQGCDTLINVASIGFGIGPGIVRAAEQARVKRAIFVSTTAIFTQLNASSKTVRIEAEASIRTSALEWTILRPTMIYGSGRDRNICRLIRYVRRFPVLPVFGTGNFLLQPIYVEDLASAIVAAMESSSTVRMDYNLAGKAAISYNDLVRTVARLLGRRIRLWHLPHGLVVRLLEFAERRRIRLPIKAEQILRLNENKAFSWNVAQRDFGFAPRSFAAGARAELCSMGIPVAATE